MSLESQIAELEQNLQNKQQKLTQLKTKFYQSEQCLQNLSQKYSTNQKYQLFCAQIIKAIKINDTQYKLQFIKSLVQGLRDLENWEYCWLSVIKKDSKSVSEEVGLLDPLTISLKDSDNINVSIIDQLKSSEDDKFTWAFTRQQNIAAKQSDMQLDLIIAKVLSVNADKGEINIECTENINEYTVLDFKVYHPVVESTTNIEK
ncbi:Conserved_hypothetical protein [Hexamita inflata]|uniref:Uncharacterized protein n=1 Tax=Hexamita inflata TaxID=28002 RepID=A0AA86QPK5_9EUKA|nr:Conserved hypothetical protein [Hexamita inflata]